ncbi:MAG: DUF2807 domain-containing protein [Oscillospiraceae bacterium]|nr:DUF2807 domain-containing protein [Oscillospiraceae bacterium]
MKIILSFILTFMMIACISCVSIGSNAVHGQGEMKDSSFEVSNYTKVNIDGGCEVIYSNKSSNELKVSMQDNILKEFNESVSSDTLNIKWNKSIITDTSSIPKIYISNPNLDTLTINGAVKISEPDVINVDTFTLNVEGACDLSISLSVKNFNTKVSGAGKMSLSGSAENATMTIDGIGEIKASGLETKVSSISINGAGSAEIYCTDQLNATISGAGSISYKGDPNVNPSIEGAGSVKKMSE